MLLIKAANFPIYKRNLMGYDQIIINEEVKHVVFRQIAGALVVEMTPQDEDALNKVIDQLNREERYGNRKANN